MEGRVLVATEDPSLHRLTLECAIESIRALRYGFFNSSPIGVHEPVRMFHLDSYGDFHGDYFTALLKGSGGLGRSALASFNYTERTPEPTKLTFSVTTSSNEGLDIKIASDTIHVQKYVSAHHPVVQMVLFAEELSSDTFKIPKSAVSQTIIDMFKKSSSSTSPNMYEAGWVPAKCRPKSQGVATPEDTSVGSNGRSNEASLPVLFDACGKSEPSSTATTGTRALANKLPEFLTGDNHGAELAVDGNFSDRHALVNGINMDSMITEIGCDLTVVAPEESLHEQNILDNPSGSNGNTSIICSARKDVHEIREAETENHSADTGFTEHHVMKEEDNTVATWVVASAAPRHATGNRGLLSDFTPEHDLFVQAGDGEPMQICGRGSVITDAVVLPDVFYVPGLTKNLVSASQLTELDYCVGFARGSCFIRRMTDSMIVGKASLGEDGLFPLDYLKVPLVI